MAGIMDKIMAGMTDDKGLFQGGKQNRMFGRVRDAFEGGTSQTPVQKPPGAVGSGGFSGTPSYRPELKSFEESPNLETFRNLQISSIPGGKEGYDKRLSQFMTEGYAPDETGPMSFTEARDYALHSFSNPESGDIQTNWQQSDEWWKHLSEDEQSKFFELSDTGYAEKDPAYLTLFGGRDSSGNYVPQSSGTSWRPNQPTSMAIAALENKPSYIPQKHSFSDVPNVQDVVGQISQTTRGMHPLEKERFAQGGKGIMKEYGELNKQDPRIENAGY